MAALGDTAGILFKIRADSSDAVRDIAKVRGEIAGLGTSAQTAGGGMSALANPAALATAAVVAIGAAAVTAAVGLFNLTKSASEYGSAINDATLKSGVSTDAIQALGFAAEQSGSSMDAIAGSVAKFSTLLGQATLGNEKAKETLAQFGITATDVDGALTQAIAKIQGMTDATQQNAAAAALFKDRGGEVVKTIREMGGSLPDTIKKLQDMGIMMSTEDTKAADAFGDSLDLLGTQAKLMGYKFANEFMPQVTAAIQSISRFLVENKDVIRGWGREIGTVVNGVSNIFRALPAIVSGVFSAINTLFGTSLSTAASWANGMRIILGPIGELLRMVSGVGASAGDDIRAGLGNAASAVIATPKLNIGGGGGGGGGRGGGGGQSAAEKAQKANDDAFQARSDELKRMLDTYEAVANRIVAQAKLDLAQGNIDATKFAELEMAVAERVANYKLELLNKELLAAQQLNQKTADLENQIGVQTENNRSLALKNETERLEALNKVREDNAKKYAALEEDLTNQLKAINDERQANYIESEVAGWRMVIANEAQSIEEQNRLRGEATNALSAILETEKQRKLGVLKEEYEAKKQKIEDEVKDEAAKYKLLAELDELYKQQLLLSEEDFQKRFKEILDGFAIPVGDSEEKGYSPFQGLIDGWNQFYNQVMEQGPTLSQTMQGIGGLMVSAFNGMANAIGGVVQQWVLYGETGPAVMRKILAQALASIAAEAAVRAIWETALGFAALFLNPGEAAAHFTAAAIFGSIAVGAGLAGRAVAGDSFKKQTSAATGQSAGSTANSGQGSGNKGGAYSSQKDVVVENGRNTPGRFAVELLVRGKDAFADMFAFEISKNGRLRSAIQDAAAA